VQPKSQVIDDSLRAQLAAKEAIATHLGEFCIGLGYTGDLTEKAGREWIDRVVAEHAALRKALEVAHAIASRCMSEPAEGGRDTAALVEIATLCEAALGMLDLSKPT
jgi:hypothetical protein